MALQQVSAHVFVATTHLGSNNSIVVNDGRVALIDAPHKPTDAIAWSKTVAEHGDVDFLVNTDHHPDHTIGNSFLDGTIAAYEGTREALLTSPWSREYLLEVFAIIDPPATGMGDRAFFPRLPTVTFSNRLQLHVGEVSLHLRHAPGHTPNSTLTYLPQDRVLFTGDNVCEAGLPSFRQSSVRGWLAAVDLAETYDFDVLVPGHGAVTDRATIGRFRARGLDLMRTIQRAIDGGVERDEILDTLEFEDRNHVTTENYVGYPNHLVEGVQRSSIATLHDDLVADPCLGQLLGF